MAEFVYIPGTVEKHAKVRTLADDMIFDPFPELRSLGFTANAHSLSWVNKDGQPCVSYHRFLDENGFIVVPKGFRSDGFSIPGWIQWLLGYRHGYASEAAILHDWLFDAFDLEAMGREIVGDKVFLWALKAMGVNWCRRTAYYLGVRMFGGMYRSYLRWSAARAAQKPPGAG